MSETALFDRLFIGDGEYVRADTAINTVGALNAEIASLRAQLDEARRKAIEDAAKVADKHSLENDISTRCDSIWLGRMGAAQNIANAIRALLSESKT